MGVELDPRVPDCHVTLRRCGYVAEVDCHKIGKGDGLLVLMHHAAELLRGLGDPDRFDEVELGEPIPSDTQRMTIMYRRRVSELTVYYWRFSRQGAAEFVEDCIDCIRTKRSKL